MCYLRVVPAGEAPVHKKKIPKVLSLVPLYRVTNAEALTCQFFFLLTDTSPEFYPKITSSRTYDDRLDTLGKVRGQPIDY